MLLSKMNLQEKISLLDADVRPTGKVSHLGIPDFQGWNGEYQSHHSMPDLCRCKPSPQARGAECCDRNPYTYKIAFSSRGPGTLRACIGQYARG